MKSSDTETASGGARIEDFNTVKIDLLGRFMREDRAEFPCRVEAMSPAAASVVSVATPQPGERIIAYIDHIGRIEGSVIETAPDGFQVGLQISQRKREKLAAQLTFFANRNALDLPEDRRHDRVTPNRAVAELILPDQRIQMVKIIDLSLSGAAVVTEARPPIGSAVSLGPIRGRCVRHLETGFAIEFASLQTEDFLNRHF